MAQATNGLTTTRVNEANLSRRRMLAGTTAAALAAVPGAAAALPGTDPTADAELIEVVAEFFRRVAWAAADGERQNKLFAEWEAKFPPPDVLLRLPGDEALGIEAPFDGRTHYRAPGDVAELRRPLPTAYVLKTKGADGEWHSFYGEWLTNPADEQAREARATEIVAAYDKCDAERDAAAPDWDAMTDARWDYVREVEHQLAEIPATTAAGFAAKITALRHHLDDAGDMADLDHTPEGRLCLSIVRDLEAMLEAAGPLEAARA
jgi:hypothetical protein